MISVPPPTRSRPPEQRTRARAAPAGWSVIGSAPGCTGRFGRWCSRIRQDATRSAGSPSRTDKNTHSCRRPLSASAEGECVGLGAGLEERDLQGPLAHRAGLAHKLVHAARVQLTLTVLVHVQAFGAPRTFAIDEHAERDRVVRTRIQNEVCVACVVPEDDAPPGLAEDEALRPDRPRPVEGPTVQR